MKNQFIFGLLVSLLAASPKLSFAQKRIEGLAAAGPHGIFVLLGGDVASRAHLRDSIAGYRLERREVPNGTWLEVAEVEAPNTLEEFEARIRLAFRFTPDPMTVEQIPVQKLWEKIERLGKVDSLGFSGGLLAVRLALGVEYLDTTAVKKTTYEYRVSKLDLNGKPLVAVVSNTISFPPVVKFTKPRLVEKRGTEKRVALTWRAGKGEMPKTFSVFRREQPAAEFHQIWPRRIIALRSDTTLVMIEDTLVLPTQIYEYYLVPGDYYGNFGASSDTVLVRAFDFTAVPLPADLKTGSLDSIGGIRLSWRLPHPRGITSLKIFRSVVWDSNYAQIAELPPGDTTYIDQMAEPMKQYFYYMIMTGPLGEKSPPTARVFGVFKSGRAPLPPWIATSAGLKNGIRLEIVSPETYIAGYRVYRSDGYGRALKLVSDLVPYKDSVTVFVDSSPGLTGKVHYGYAVRAENTSHIESGFSDTVYVRPLIPTEPPIPLNLSASRETNGVKLYWTDLVSLDQALDGYWVLRREVGSSKRGAAFKKITDSLVPANRNYFIDTTVIEGKIYEFAVQSADIYGGVSGLSASVEVEVAASLPLAPGLVRAERFEQGILIRWEEASTDSIAAYKMYRYERGKNPQLLAQVAQGSNEFLDKTASPGKLYFYYLTCVNKKGIESLPSDEVSIRP